MKPNLPERYQNYPLFLNPIQTVADNPHFTNGDVAVVIFLKEAEQKDLRNLIDDGDFLMLEGDAGTGIAYHIVQVKMEETKLTFHATSKNLTKLPVTEVDLNQLDQANVFGKILFTFSNKVMEVLNMDFGNQDFVLLSKENAYQINKERDVTFHFPSLRDPDGRLKVSHRERSAE